MQRVNHVGTFGLFFRSLPNPCFQTPSVSDPEIQITEAVRSEMAKGQTLFSALDVRD